MVDVVWPEDRGGLSDVATRARAAATPGQPDAPPDLTVLVRGDDVELGHRLADQLGEPDDIVATEDRVWQYLGGSWRVWHDNDLAKMAQSFVNLRVEELRNNEVVLRPIKLSASAVRGTVAMCKVSIHQTDFFAKAPHGTPFASTFARVVGKRVVVEPLGREHRVRQEHVPTWDLPDVPEGQNPPRPETVDRLLAETWAGCADVAERIQYFWEWLGAALCGISTRWKDTPMFIGLKDSGKSALLKVISCLFPVASHRNVTLHQMSSEYHRAHLSSGRVNFVNEIPARELLEGEAAKAILSGDPVNCRFPSMNPFDWVPRMAHAFAGNDLPPTRDPALVERFVVLDCNNIVPQELQDRTLGDKIMAEAPLIALAAIYALGSLLERGHFIRPASSVAACVEWNELSDPIATWCASNVEKSAETYQWEEGDALYRAFTAWAKDNGHAVMSSTRFGRAIGRRFVKKWSNGPKYQCRLLTAGQAQTHADWRGRTGVAP